MQISCQHFFICMKIILKFGSNLDDTSYVSMLLLFHRCFMTSLYLNKIAYTVNNDGGISFFYPGEEESSWSCYPIVGLTAEEVLEELKAPLQRRGWITPRDAQEVACQERLATYSKR